MQKHLTKAKLFNELKNRPGLVPIEIDANNKQLIWMDLETYHCYEGFFHKSLDTFAHLKTLQNKETVSFTTELNALTDENILTDNIYPTGFIFHAGRCGSTLLAKALAHSRDNMVFSEAAPHNQILTVRDNSFNDENKMLYKHLILAMGRKRVTTHKTHLIKFTSFNILFFNFIRSVFPDVPAVFLYREPIRILSSFNKSAPAWLSLRDETNALMQEISMMQTAQMKPLEFIAKVLSDFFTQALRAGDSLNLLNYNLLTKENLSAVLKVFNIEVTKQQLIQMQSQFKYNSKSENRLEEFSKEELDNKKPDVPDLNESTTNNVLKLYEELSKSNRNLILN